MTLSQQDRVAVFGTEQPPMAETRLDAGKLSIRIADGQIAALSWGGVEILRGVTYFLRDADWATPLGTTRTEVTEAGADGFAATITGAIDAGGIRFDYTMTITGQADGTLRIATTGTALSEFRANRVGLTVLHPLDCAGAPLNVLHSDGRAERTAFPVRISPAQPVFDIAGLSYGLAGGDLVEIGFRSITPDGSAQCFEMEDQRNWGDASYKTYVGSLLDPWPFAVAKGAVFAQDITIRMRPGAVAPAPDPVAEGGAGAFRVPAFGVSVPRGGAVAALANLRGQEMFRPACLSAYLSSEALDPAELTAIAEMVTLLDAPLVLELEVHGDPARALPHVAEQVAAAGLSPESVLACPEPYLHSYQPNGDWPEVMPLDQFYGLVRAAFPGGRVGGGMLTYFTELNRKWPPAGAIDYVGHSYCPIVHAADDLTVVQNIETLAYIDRSVAAALPETPYEIVSAQLSMRQNPYGAAPQPNPENARIAMAKADPREAAQFAGLWMLEVAEVLARGHVTRVCLGALSGPASIFGANGAKRPSYHALAALCALEGADAAAFAAAKARLVAQHFAQAAPVFADLQG